MSNTICMNPWFMVGTILVIGALFALAAIHWINEEVTK